jgi:hypothetical protein
MALPPREALVGYSQGRVTDATLLRALLTYNKWMVPCEELLQPDRTEGDTGVHVLPGNLYRLDHSPGPGARHLWLFTDPEAAFAARSQGMSLGTYADGLHGTEVFGKVRPEWEGVMVNLGSPREETWFIPHESIPLYASFAETFLLEGELTRLATIGSGQANSPEETSKLVKRLGEFPRFEVPILASTPSLLAVRTRQGPTAEVVLCTWADCVEAVKASLPDDQRADVRKVVLDGAAVFKRLALEEYVVLAINPFGPGPGLSMRLDGGQRLVQILNAWPPD